MQRTDPPQPIRRGARSSHDFGAHSQARHPDQEARNAELGRAGELLALRHEKDCLQAAGRSDLAERVTHVAVVEGDSAEYDIRSFTPDRSHRFIEVKTTRGAASTAFFVSPNQVAFSEDHSANYVLLRIFAYSESTDSARFYESTGPLTRHFDLQVSEFRASMKPIT
ncbi:DUF3883 domain-containing protein [Friedmanniella luteola]|uniref:DUF3883 domain-containing protein n=1 Tax=Friedmanniella luteola TaxID=546871 RepID=UPI000B86C6A0